MCLWAEYLPWLFPPGRPWSSDRWCWPCQVQSPPSASYSPSSLPGCWHPAAPAVWLPENKTEVIKHIIVKQLRCWPLRNWDTALKCKCPWNTLKSDTRCQSLARKLNSVINERSVVWSREGRSRWDGSRPQLILVPPEDSIFQTIKAASKVRHENVLRQSKMWRYFR